MHVRAGLYLGFPGIGKTPMAKYEPNVLDLDAGHVRRALAEVAGLAESEIDEAELAHFIAVLARIYIAEGWAVITNLPAVMEYHVVNRMYVQSAGARRSIENSSKKLGVTPEVVQTYIEEWALAAKSHGVPVIRLRKGLDYVFRQNRMKKQKQNSEPNSDSEHGCLSSDIPEKEPKMGEFW